MVVYYPNRCSRTSIIAEKISSKYSFGKHRHMATPFFQTSLYGGNYKKRFFRHFAPIFWSWKHSPLIYTVGRHFFYFGFQISQTTPYPIFDHAPFYTGNTCKSAFSVLCIHFLVLEQFSSNINRRKAFCLFWFSCVSDHAQAYS